MKLIIKVNMHLLCPNMMNWHYDYFKGNLESFDYISKERFYIKSRATQI